MCDKFYNKVKQSKKPKWLGKLKSYLSKMLVWMPKKTTIAASISSLVSDTAPIVSPRLLLND